MITMNPLLRNFSVNDKELLEVFQKHGIVSQFPIDEKAFVADVYATMSFIVTEVVGECQI